MTAAGLSTLVDLFREEAIERLDQICALTDNDLRDLGLKMGVRQRLLNAIAAAHVPACTPVSADTTPALGTTAASCDASAHSRPADPPRILLPGVHAFLDDGRAPVAHSDFWDGAVPVGGVHLPIDAAYSGLVRVHDAPPLYICESFLSPAECDDLIAICDPLLMRSRTEGGVTPTRTSRSCFLGRDVGAAPELLRKVSRLTGKPSTEMEPPQLARYECGEFYGPHHDAADPLLGGGSIRTGGGGQRVCTVLIYLNEPAAGGCTRFERLMTEVQPRKGRAVVFFPSFLDGRLDKRYLHEARPAVDTKYVCQIWIRQAAIEDDSKPADLGFALLSALREPSEARELERVEPLKPSPATRPARAARPTLRPWEERHASWGDHYLGY